MSTIHCEEQEECILWRNSKATLLLVWITSYSYLDCTTVSAQVHKHWRLLTQILLKTYFIFSYHDGSDTVQSTFFCKNGDVLTHFGNWSFPFIHAECFYMCNTSVFIATFCLHSSWWYQTRSSLFLYLLLEEKHVCSVRSFAKAAGLGKCCSLLPQTETVLFCDYSCSSTVSVAAQLKDRASLLYRECYLMC